MMSNETCLPVPEHIILHICFFFPLGKMRAMLLLGKFS